MRIGATTLRRLALLVLAICSVDTAGVASDDRPGLGIIGAETSDVKLVDQKIEGPNFNRTIPIFGRGADEKIVRVETALFGPDGAPVPVIMTPADRTTPVSAGAPLTIGSDKASDVTLSATLPAAGNYNLLLRLVNDKGQFFTVGGKVERTATALPGEGIVPSLLLTLFTGEREPVVAIPLTAPADRGISVQVQAARVTLAAAGAGATGEVGTSASIRTAGACAGEEPAQPWITIPRNGSVPLAIRFCGLGGAGEYHARFDLVGDGGGRRAVDVGIKLRDPWCRALALLLAGSVIGGIVAWWRVMGRGQADALLEADDLSDQIDALIASFPVPEHRDRLRKLHVALFKFRKDIAAGGKTAASDALFQDLETRRDQLARLAWQLQRRNVGHISADLFGEAVDAIVSAPIANVTAAVDAVEKAITGSQAQTAKNLVAGAGDDSGEVPNLPFFKSSDRRHAIQTKRGILNFLSSAVLFASFMATALLTLWWTNPVWGSMSDYIVAVFVGMAAFGGVAGVLGSFRTTIQQVRG